MNQKDIIMDEDIQKLINSTTIVKVEDNLNRQVIFGDEYYVSRFQRDQGKQIDLSDLVRHWENKWIFFGDSWTKEGQNCRFLYDSFRLFYHSFEQLMRNKADSINATFTDPKKSEYLNNITGVNLYGIYHHGKKCIDLLKELNLINQKHTAWGFCNKYSETRNKLIEHNYNPKGLNMQIDPSLWSLIGTKSLMTIRIHNAKERAYDAYIDYYQDYYDLESVISQIIK